MAQPHPIDKRCSNCGCWERISAPLTKQVAILLWQTQVETHPGWGHCELPSLDVDRIMLNPIDGELRTAANHRCDGWMPK